MDLSIHNIDWLNILGIAGLIFILTFAVICYVLIDTLEKNKKLQKSLNKIMRSFNELDEQAKLIVKTDLELNKAQEELDKRLNGLEALQKTSRLISTTLDENEIFHRIDQPLLTDLGFEKTLILLYDKSGGLEYRVQFGFAIEEIHFIISRLQKEEGMQETLKEGHTFSTASAPKQRKEQLIQIFGVEHVVLAPILSQNGCIGLLFVGNRSDASSVTAGDEELISILANQIGQSLENAQLFEQVYRSSQVLETKVQDRTKQLASALEEVQQISKMKSEFISAVSHELRTPLTSIKGYASLLMTGKIGQIPEEVKERLEKINKHSDNLVKMINELLDIARIESGGTEMRFTKSDVAAIIDNVHDLLTPQMREKNIQWVVEIAEGVPKAYIDSSHIERVFINLVSNAIKFTPEGGIINIKLSAENGFIHVSVKDTGIGIGKDDLPKLFNEFYRVENEINQNVKGTGLGLSLVKNIVEAHKGSIEVNSEIGRGTVFHFKLPIEKPA